MKLQRRVLLTLFLVTMGMITGGKMASAQNFIPINAANFPDVAIRNALEREAQYVFEEDDNYESENMEAFRYDSGIYYIDTDATFGYLSVGDDEEEIVYNVDCLKKFKNIESLNIGNLNASSVTLDNISDQIFVSQIEGATLNISCSKVNNVEVRSETASNLTISAPNVTDIRIGAGSKFTSISVIQTEKLKSLSIIDAKIKSLNVSGLPELENLSIGWTPISEIKGLEKLKQLCSLYVTDTDLRCLDVSANKKLETLGCDRNDKMTSIKGSSALVTLIAEGNKNLKNVNVKNSKKLEILRVSNNKNLKSIDVSKNTNLKVLGAAYTRISQLNVKNNKKLTNLSCYQAKLSKLNVKKNKKLVALDVNDNKNLKSIDVSNNSNLVSLDISGTKISKINLKKNKKLKWLCVDDSRIKQINLHKQKEFTFYFKTKKGKTIYLKKYIGTGYNATKKSKALSYNKNSGTVKVKKKGWNEIKLKKGKRTVVISVYAR